MHIPLPFPLLLLLLSLLPSTQSTSPPAPPAAPKLILTLPALPSPLPSSTHASLSTHNHTLTTPLLRNQTFVFRSSALKAGASYLLNVHCSEYAFAPLRVDVVGDGKEGGGGGGSGEKQVEVYRTFLGHAWDEKGELKGRSSAPAGGRDAQVELEVLGRKEFYSSREGFSPLSLLRSPMILLALVSTGLVFGMPYLMENMDPEMRKEFEEQQKRSPLAGMAAGGGGGGGFDLAGLLAGRSSSSGASIAEGERGTGGRRDDGPSSGQSSGQGGQGRVRRRG